jgi:S1-C subfamily serine protease
MEPQNGQSGALVAALEPRGPADRAGVKPGDVIVSFAGNKIDDPEDVAAATLELEPGTKVTLDVLRGGSHKDIQVALGTRPPPRELQRR